MSDKSNYYIIKSLSNSAKFAWYFSLLLASFLTIIHVAEFIWDLPFSYGFLFTADSDLVRSQIEPDANEAILSIGESTLTIDSGLLSYNYPTTYLLLVLLDLLIISIVLYGIYQFSQLLQSAAEDVFTIKNIYRIEKIAYLFILLIPSPWLFQRWISFALDLQLEQYGLQITSVPYLDFSYCLYGCLMLALAEVFKRGRDAYQELKLTV